MLPDRGHKFLEAIARIDTIHDRGHPNSARVDQARGVLVFLEHRCLRTSNRRARAPQIQIDTFVRRCSIAHRVFE